MSRDLHDVLGHRLGVIALRAELAGQDEIQVLARETLQEVRAAVHDHGTLDLDDQLRGARLVLGSAGVDLDADVEDVPLGPAVSQLLAAALREAVTNVLRHSDARRCHLSLGRAGSVVRLLVTNDGATACEASAGTGIGGLADRARLVGGTVRAERDGDVFRLEVEVPT